MIESFCMSPFFSFGCPPEADPHQFNLSFFSAELLPFRVYNPLSLEEVYFGSHVKGVDYD